MFFFRVPAETAKKKENEARTVSEKKTRSRASEKRFRRSRETLRRGRKILASAERSAHRFFIPDSAMQKITLPVIFLAAVAAALFYVSQEEHGSGTLFLLAAVLLVGQVCATLPFILEARKPRAGTPNADGENVKKILANQQIIHEDLRSLGETLIKRLNAIAEKQNETEKTLLDAHARSEPDFSVPADELFERIRAELDERFEKIESAPADEKLDKKLDAISEHLDDLTCAVENLSFAADEEADDENEAFEDEDAATEDIEDAAGTPDENDDKGTFAFPENHPNEDSEDDDAGTEDFPEDAEESEETGAQEESATPADEEPPVPAPAKQGELELGIPNERGATLVLEAMLGIENKPFLRGNAPGVNDAAGTPMEFVEIGKWSFDFAPFSEEITVRILRNDNENEPLGEPVTLAPGQTLELAYVPERA